MLYLLSMGIENYRDPKITKVDYAIKDATEFANAWMSMGIEDIDVTVISEDHVTVNKIQAVINELKGKINEYDTVIVYYAGHGFNVKGKNLISVVDTYVDMLPETALELSVLYDRISELNAKKTFLFIDACHSGYSLATKSRSTIQEFSADELRMYDSESKAILAFSACSSNEKSYPSDEEEHGCWTACLLRALKGEVPDILEKGELLTANSLQKFLAVEVPKLVRNLYKGPVLQTPVMFGAVTSDPIVADLGEVIKENQGDDNVLSINLEDICLFGVKNESIRYLSGFKHFHKMPSDRSEVTRKFVKSISNDEVRGIGAEIHQLLHSKLGIKYSQMKVEESAGGYSVISPIFDVYVSSDQSRADIGQCEIHIEVSDFKDASIIRNNALVEVLGGYIDGLSCYLGDIDLSLLVEDIEGQGWVSEVRYMPGELVEFHVEDENLEFVVSESCITVKTISGGLKSLLGTLEIAIKRLSSIEKLIQTTK